MPERAKVVLTRRIAASPERVFEACTKPELLARWFSPRLFDVCEVEADARVGGKFAFRMTGEPGTYGAEGVYREIVPGRKLVLTWRWVEGPGNEPPDGVVSLVTFDLAPDGQGTLLMLTHDNLPDQEQAKSHREGWTEALDKLERTLADYRAHTGEARRP